MSDQDQNYLEDIRHRNQKINIVKELITHFQGFDFNQSIRTHIVSFPEIESLRVSQDRLIQCLLQTTLIDPVTILADQLVQICSQVTQMEKDVHSTQDQLEVRMGLQMLKTGMELVLTHLVQYD